MLDKIKKNYLLMVKNYDKKHKSDHWNKFLNQSNLGKNKIDNLENFRKPKIFGNSLTHGLSDDFGFIPTMNLLVNLLKLKSNIDFNEYSEVRIGNPNFYDFDGVLTNYNELRTIKLLINLEKYISENSKIICEIGGGFGSLASKIKKRYPNKTIILIDIPETLILQSYYLSSVFPEYKFCFYEEFISLSAENLNKNSYDFIIIPPWAINKIIGNISIDLFINSHSFQEMDREVIIEYFNFIQKTIKVEGTFYNLNKNFKLINNKAIKISEYPYDDKWKILKKKIDSGNPNMHEVVTQRIKNKNIQFLEEIRKIPQTNPSLRKISLIKIIFRKILDCIMLFVPKKILFKLMKIYL
tara:strand:- start:2009 stop:3070 length:1062 start_codon:yes stop_codon:yes gene_type:complete